MWRTAPMNIVTYKGKHVHRKPCSDKDLLDNYESWDRAIIEKNAPIGLLTEIAGSNIIAKQKDEKELAPLRLR